jgi:eukaryotic-like serine/threonine-protein kinase
VSAAPDRVRLVREVFLAASACDEPERDGVLDRMCGSDGDLRVEVESLLRHDDGDPDHVLTKPLLGSGTGLRASSPMPAPELRAGARIGAYTIERFLGAGGMGAVYLARQERPSRTVALKIIRPGATSAALLRRLELEAELLGRLQHPGIAQIFEAGTANDGLGPRPFFAMEFVDGLNLLRYAEANGLTTRERLELMLKVCDAVEHAHQKGVIHRDLKPGNILVDGAGQPKVLDFGVARAAEGGETATLAGQLIGTLPYMSPEQVGAEPEVDTRSDVYALGVVMYQLVSGMLPHDVDGRPIADAIRIIRQEVPRPLGALGRQWRGDVETIVSRAMDKERVRRYQSADALGAEIRRFLAGAPIEAKRDSAIYVLRKHLRRYRSLVAGVCLLIIGLSAFSVYAWSEARRRGELIDQTREARDRAQGLAAIADAARSKAEQQSDELRRTDYFNRIGFAQAAFAGGDVARLRRLLAGCPESMRGWEWDYLTRISDVSTRRLNTREGDRGGITACWSPNRVMTFRFDGPIHLWDSATGALTRKIASPYGTRPPIMSRDGSLILSGRGAKLFAWNAATGASQYEADLVEPGYIADISPDGTRALLVVPEKHIEVLDAVNGRVLSRAMAPPFINKAVFSADGSMFATCHEQALAAIWKTSDGSRVKDLPTHPMGIRCIAFDPSGERIVTGCNDGYVRVWPTLPAAPAPPLATSTASRSDEAPIAHGHVHSNKVSAIAFGPRGDTIATGSTDTFIKLIDARTCEPVRTLAGHAETVTALTFLDDHTLSSSSRDGTVRWWTLAPSADDLVLDARGSTIYGAALSRDGERLYTAGQARLSVRVRDSSTLALVRTFEAYGEFAMDVELTSDESTLFTSTRNGEVVAWDIPSGKRVRRHPGHTGSANDIALSEERGWLLSCGDDGLTRVSNTKTGEAIREWHGHEGGIIGMTCSPDGAIIVTGGRDNRARVWSGVTWDQIAVLQGHDGYVTSVCLSPDKTMVAGTSEDGTAIVWPVGGGEGRVCTGHQGPVYCAAFSPDGRRLATGGFDNTVRLWDVGTGVELLTLRGHLSSIHALMFSADGNRILSCSDSGGIRVWSARPVSGMPHVR